MTRIDLWNRVRQHVNSGGRRTGQRDDEPGHLRMGCSPPCTAKALSLILPLQLTRGEQLHHDFSTFKWPNIDPHEAVGPAMNTWKEDWAASSTGGRLGADIRACSQTAATYPRIHQRHHEGDPQCNLAKPVLNSGKEDWSASKGIDTGYLKPVATNGKVLLFPP